MLRMNEDVVSGILQSVQNIALSSVVRGYNRKNNAGDFTHEGINI